MEQTVDKIFDDTYILNYILDKNRRKKMEDDGRENVEIDLDDKTFMELARMAHEKRLTLNDFFNIMLKEYMDELETIEIEIADDDFILIAKEAHENDITFNSQAVKILKEAIEKNESGEQFISK